jgi:hypothetical protein
LSAGRSGIGEDDQHPLVPAKAGTNPTWKDLADELIQ